MPDPRFPHEGDMAAEGSPLAVDGGWRSVGRGLRLVRVGLVLFMAVFAGAMLGGLCAAAGNLTPNPVMFGGRRGSAATVSLQQTVVVVTGLIAAACAATGSAGIVACALGHAAWLRVPTRTGARRWAAASFAGTLVAAALAVMAAALVLADEYGAGAIAAVVYVFVQVAEQVAVLLFLRRVAQYLDAGRLILAVRRLLVAYGITAFVAVGANLYGVFTTPPAITGGGLTYDPMAMLIHLATLAVGMGLAWAALGLLDQTGEALKYGRDPQPPARGTPYAVH